MAIWDEVDQWGNPIKQPVIRAEDIKKLSSDMKKKKEKTGVEDFGNAMALFALTSAYTFMQGGELDWEHYVKTGEKNNPRH